MTERVFKVGSLLQQPLLQPLHTSAAAAPLSFASSTDNISSTTASSSSHNNKLLKLRYADAHSATAKKAHTGGKMADALRLKPTPEAAFRDEDAVNAARAALLNNISLLRPIGGSNALMSAMGNINNNNNNNINSNNSDCNSNNNNNSNIANKTNSNSDSNSDSNINSNLLSKKAPFIVLARSNLLSKDYSQNLAVNSIMNNLITNLRARSDSEDQRYTESLKIGGGGGGGGVVVGGGGTTFKSPPPTSKQGRTLSPIIVFSKSNSTTSLPISTTTNTTTSANTNIGPLSSVSLIDKEIKQDDSPQKWNSIRYISPNISPSHLAYSAAKDNSSIAGFNSNLIADIAPPKQFARSSSVCSTSNNSPLHSNSNGNSNSYSQSYSQSCNYNESQPSYLHSASHDDYENDLYDNDDETNSKCSTDTSSSYTASSIRNGQQSLLLFEEEEEYPNYYYGDYGESRILSDGPRDYYSGDDNDDNNSANSSSEIDSSSVDAQRQFLFTPLATPQIVIAGPIGLSPVHISSTFSLNSAQYKSNRNIDMNNNIIDNNNGLSLFDSKPAFSVVSFGSHNNTKGSSSSSNSNYSKYSSNSNHNQATQKSKGGKRQHKYEGKNNTSFEKGASLSELKMLAIQNNAYLTCESRNKRPMFGLELM